MAPDLAQIGGTLIVFGCILVVSCSDWHRNPADYLTRALSVGRTVWTSLYAKGPQS